METMPGGNSERREQEPTITAWFKVKQTPRGGAPEEIKQQWVGVPLPLRYEKSEEPRTSLGENVATHDLVLYDDAITITMPDALKALRLFGRSEAADWWENWSLEYYGTAGRDVLLDFMADEGDLIPDSVARTTISEIADFN